jgi:6,7-dimethyl-8-ribityllumazine synthase
MGDGSGGRAGRAPDWPVQALLPEISLWRPLRLPMIGAMNTANEDVLPSPPRVAVVVSRYNWSVTQPMLAGARAEYAARGHEAGSVAVFEAPGAFELPALAMAAADTGRYRGVLAIGCIIRGETRHDQYIAQAVASGLVGVTLQTGIPVALGVLTVENAEQARARAGGEQGNKGQESMAALLDTIIAMDAIRDGEEIDIARGQGPGASQVRDKAARGD